jgi:hypothetical protein
MTRNEAMLAAHVQFELDRWRAEQGTGTLAAEVSALYAWLAQVRLDDLVDVAAVQQAAVQVLCRGELSDAAVDAVVDAVIAGHLATGEHRTTLAELVPREQYDRAARAVAGMAGAREEVITQVTTSEVYSRLMSHVLYQGIKNYVQSENLIAKKVPGAAALMRFGQNAVNAAAPALEQSVDRQLTAFVNSNISDTIRDSRDYLVDALDEAVLGAVADEVWQRNADVTVAQGVGLVPAEALAEVVRAAWQAWLVMRSTPFVESVVRQAVADFVAMQGQWAVADLLGDAGLTEDVAVDLVAAVVGPAVALADSDGLLEQRIRARLAPFYDWYGQDDAAGPPG